MGLSYPIIGEWYRSPTGELLEVVAVDESDATVEIQYFDGTVEELDFDAWQQIDFESASPPEDWSGSVDIDREDFMVDTDGALAVDWSDPLEYLDRAE